MKNESPQGMKTVNEIMAALRAPIELSWKPQSKYGTSKLICVCYLDSRDVQNRLDEVLGIDGWQSQHYGEVGKLFCKLSIKLNGEWISKTDAGMDSNVAADKGAASDSFKRAAVMFGVGRFTYDTPNVLMPFVSELRGNKTVEIPVDSGGKKLYGQKLSDYIVKHYDKLEKI
jgi:hypothetical protein